MMMFDDEESMAITWTALTNGEENVVITKVA
jgi:hypothetical protein